MVIGFCSFSFEKRGTFNFCNENGLQRMGSLFVFKNLGKRKNLISTSEKSLYADEIGGR